MNTMRKIWILCLVMAWGFTGCYEDKGDNQTGDHV